MRACQSHDVYIRAIPRAEWAYLFGPFSPRILTREAPSQACELFAIGHDVLLRVPMNGIDSVLENAYIASLLCGKPSHDLNTGPIYNVSSGAKPHRGRHGLETNSHFP